MSNLRPIPVWHPFLPPTALTAIRDVLDIGYLGLGKKVFEFEEAVANIVGVDKSLVVSTHTGQSALHTILSILGVSASDSVITPALNNVADFQAILACGAVPEFVDCSPSTGTIDLDSIPANIAASAKALIVLDYASNFVDLDAASKYCQKNNLLLIYDAAHSFGSCHSERLALCDATMFSFDPIKTFTAIDAGICIFSTETHAQKARHFRMMGMEQDSQALRANKRSSSYDVSSHGYRYHLSNIHAALGLDQLNYFQHIKDARNLLAYELRNRLSQSKLIHSWIPLDALFIPFMNVALFKPAFRDPVKTLLRDRFAIETAVHWTPGHHFTLFSSTHSRALPNTEYIYSSMLSLPLSPCMTIEDITYIANSILEIERDLL